MCCSIKIEHSVLNINPCPQQRSSTHTLGTHPHDFERLQCSWRLGQLSLEIHIDFTKTLPSTCLRLLHVYLQSMVTTGDSPGMDLDPWACSCNWAAGLDWLLCAHFYATTRVEVSCSVLRSQVCSEIPGLRWSNAPSYLLGRWRDPRTIFFFTCYSGPDYKFIRQSCFDLCVCVTENFVVPDLCVTSTSAHKGGLVCTCAFKPLVHATTTASHSSACTLALSPLFSCPCD